MSQTWKIVTRERFWEMLGMMPPARRNGLGFLVGEPYSYRACAVTKRGAETFSAFAEDHRSEVYFECEQPLTVAEFDKLTLEQVRFCLSTDSPVHATVRALREVNRALDESR